MKLAILLILLLGSAFTNADENAANKLYLDSKKKAQESISTIVGLQNGGAEINSIQNIIQNPNGDANNKATQLGELPQTGESSREKEPEEGKSFCSKDNCNMNNVFSAKAVNKREAKLEEFGFRKNKDNQPEDSKGYLDKANKQIKEVFATKNPNSINGEYKDCTPIEKVFTHKEYHECDQYYDVQYDNCPIAQIVEIDPKYTYLCNKKREEVTKTCHEEAVSISCKKDAECDNGGIIAASVKSDMKWEYNYPNLTIGTIADNYWSGWCSTFDRVTEFEIRNKDKITEFLLTDVGFDDYLWITLNGSTIYVGPDGGSKIEVVNGRVDNGNGRHGCERQTNWHFGGLNVDLRPYLREGINTLFMRVVVAGSGEGWMKIRARQHCCRDWDIKWEQKCEYEGQS